MISFWRTTILLFWTLPQKGLFLTTTVLQFQYELNHYIAKKKNQNISNCIMAKSSYQKCEWTIYFNVVQKNPSLVVDYIKQKRIWIETYVLNLRRVYRWKYTAKDQKLENRSYIQLTPLLQAFKIEHLSQKHKWKEKLRSC